MNYSTGRKLTLAGFALFILVALYKLFYRIVWDFLGISFFVLHRAFYWKDWGMIAALAIVTLGYGIMWLDEKKPIDLITAGSTGFYVGFYVLWVLDVLPINSDFNYTLASALLLIFYLVMAFRAKEKAPILSLALVFAFLFETFWMHIFHFIMKTILDVFPHDWFDIAMPHSWAYTFMYLVILIGPVACFLTSKNEN